MTQKNRVADEKLGRILRREQDMHRRILQGTLDPDFVLETLQRIIESKNDILYILASLSLHDRIILGKYDWVNENIRDTYLSDKTEKNYTVEYDLLYFNKNTPYEVALVVAEKNRLKPGNILELLKLAEIKADFEPGFPIVAFGSLISFGNNDKAVPFLDFDNGKRKLDCRWLNIGWNTGYLFFGIRQAV